MRTVLLNMEGGSTGFILLGRPSPSFRQKSPRILGSEGVHGRYAEYLRNSRSMVGLLVGLVRLPVPTLTFAVRWIVPQEGKYTPYSFLRISVCWASDAACLVVSWPRFLLSNLKKLGC